MTLLDSFPWPSPPGISIKPQWNGRHFTLGGQASRVLAYDAETSHWSDDLTSLHEAEAGHDHPIDLASRRLAVSSMGRLHASAPIILDVGCSSGFVLEDLRQTLPQASLIGADYLRGPLEGLAQRMPDIPILQFDLRKCPLPGACVDGVSCLNVLEHIDAHETALAEIYRILRPGGIAHIEVPAGPALYDIYDEHLMHHRRYCLTDLVSLARKIGFIGRKSYPPRIRCFPCFLVGEKSQSQKAHSARRRKGTPGGRADTRDEGESPFRSTYQARNPGRSPPILSVRYSQRRRAEENLTPMESTTQNEKSVVKNQDFFADNELYKTLQGELELYQFIAKSAAHETTGARRLLDIGNGGVFIFPIAHIPDIEAIDIFLEESFKTRYPTVKWTQMSALDMRFDKPFDTLIAINTLHHVIGDTVKATYKNLDKIMGEVSRNLEPNGKFVLLESTVPALVHYAL